MHFFWSVKRHKSCLGCSLFRCIFLFLRDSVDPGRHWCSLSWLHPPSRGLFESVRYFKEKPEVKAREMSECTDFHAVLSAGLLISVYGDRYCKFLTFDNFLHGPEKHHTVFKTSNVCVSGRFCTRQQDFIMFFSSAESFHLAICRLLREKIRVGWSCGINQWVYLLCTQPVCFFFTSVIRQLTIQATELPSLTSLYNEVELLTGHFSCSTTGDAMY